MRVMSNCPKCGAKVSQTDTQCLDCGLDLVQARVDIVKQAQQNARTVAKPATGAAAAANPAAAGLVVPGESAEEKRLRVFDKQQAQELRKQRPAIVVAAILAAAFTGGLATAAKGFLGSAGGFAAIKTLTYAQFKALGFGLFSDPRIMFIVCAGLALAAFLCLVGEGLRLWAVSAAITAVARGQVPNVVGVAVFTMIGLVIAAFFCPPVGLIMGILFKLSKDQDTNSLGSMMIYAAILAAAIVVVNTIWNLAAAHLKTAPAAKVTPAVSLPVPWRTA